MTLHHSGKHQVRGGDRCLDWIADQVSQVEGIEPLVGSRAGMDKERKFALAEDTPEGLKPLRRIRNIVGLGAHHHAGPAGFKARRNLCCDLGRLDR